MTRVRLSPRRGRTVGFVLCGVLIVGALAAIPFLRAQRQVFQREAASLMAAQATAAQALDSLRQETVEVSGALALEEARASARAVTALHLVIAVDSGTVALMRDGITLRTMPARFRGDRPERGTSTITRVDETVVAPVAPTVDSLGNLVATPPGDSTVQQVVLSDGTVLRAGDAALALLGGLENAPGPRMVLVSRRDFAAIRPNLVRGMKAVLF